jgi:hypothetical protein
MLKPTLGPTMRRVVRPPPPRRQAQNWGHDNVLKEMEPNSRDVI